MLRPRSGSYQWVAKETYKITPNVPVMEYTDYFDNLCQRLVAPVGRFSIHTSAEVRIADRIEHTPGAPFVEVQHLPNEALSYLLPSRYCESDRFNQMASEITANEAPGYDQVAKIESWLRETISYIPGSSDYPISAVEVYERRSGVCRDLAHLGIALCRSLSIPARMVVGYLHDLKPMDLHAWFEAFVGGQWFTFDGVPAVRLKGYVPVGFGRDAADVAIYNQFGPPVLPINYVVTVEEIAGGY